jgi:hypothetical protein
LTVQVLANSFGGAATAIAVTATAAQSGGPEPRWLLVAFLVPYCPACQARPASTRVLL